MKSSVFWDIMPCSPLKVDPRFGEYFASIFRVEEYTKQETSMKKVSGLLVGQLFHPEYEGVRMRKRAPFTKRRK
jgi:hypothetical protein